MDIIAYGAASKEKRRANELSLLLGPGVEGTRTDLKNRLDTLIESMDQVTLMANRLIIQNAVNLMKAEARLNIIIQAKRYGLDHMVFDDLLDLSGIDIARSSSYAHSTLKGEIVGGQVITKAIDFSQLNRLIIVDDTDLTFVPDTNESVFDVPLPASPNWARIGKLGSLGVITTGQSITIKKTISLKSIEVYMAYSSGQPGDVTLSVQEGVADPAGVQPIAQSKIASFRDTGIKKYQFAFDSVTLVAGKQYLFYFTTTAVSGASNENYMVYMAESGTTLDGDQYYLKHATQPWAPLQGNLSFTLKRRLNTDPVSKAYSIDDGVSWTNLDVNKSVHEIKVPPGEQAGSKKLLLKFGLSSGATLKNYGIVWT